MKKKITVASMFAGIGGIDLAFEQAGFSVVWANEIDKYACRTYRLNFGDEYLIEGDIQDVKTDDIPDFDVLISGFPCQAFSSVGLEKGFEDFRHSIAHQEKAYERQHPIHGNINKITPEHGFDRRNVFKQE